MAQELLGESQLEVFEACVKKNAAFLDAVAEMAVRGFGAPENRKEWGQFTSSTMDKVVSTLRQVGREWSDEGAAERDISFGRVIREIEALYPEVDGEDETGDKGKDQTEGTENKGTTKVRKPRSEVKIVIPGCGLGRLPMELAARGFRAQGNEFSFHMLFTSHFLLNCTMKAREFTIHPYVHSFSHVRSREYQTRPVLVPDVHPGEYMLFNERSRGRPGGELSMVAGSFDDAYLPTSSLEPDADEEEDENYNPQFKNADIVATVFFIDTAPNIFRTLDAISKLLIKGGHWINFGPLLWHYEDARADENEYKNSKESDDDDRTCGLELTMEDILGLLPKFGFKLEKHESGISCSYSLDPLSMGGYVYKCEYWVAVKV